jgi:hypothetical protein
LIKTAKKLVVGYEAENNIGPTTFCTPHYAPRFVKIKKGWKKKK